MAASCHPSHPKRQMVTSGLPSGRSLCQGQALTWQGLLQQAAQQVLTRSRPLPTATAAPQHQSWQQATPPGDLLEALMHAAFTGALFFCRRRAFFYILSICPPSLFKSSVI